MIGSLIKNFVDINFQKKTIVVCVLNQDRRVPARRSFAFSDTAALVEFFRILGPVQAVRSPVDPSE